MANKAVARIGDIAVGHTDIQGSQVIGIIQVGSLNNTNGGIGISNSESVVFFPSHPHTLVEGSPSGYRSHSVKINATGKHNSNGFKIALNNDTVPVSDEAGADAYIVSTTGNLYCKSI